jgi:hypothetical protein
MMKKLLIILMVYVFIPILGKADNNSCPDNDHPHKVDLGLPSGTRWACCNIDTDRPEMYGGYYAWGELEEKESYNWYNYSLSSAGNMYDLTAEEDVATVKWGEKWRMPTMDEFKELLKYCTWSWKEYNGIMGAWVTGPNGNAVFFPAGAMKDNNNYTARPGTYGSYWGRTHASSSQYSTELVFGTAYYKYGYSIGDFYYEMGPTGTRQTGRLVRAVGTERYINSNDYTIYITNPSFDDNLYSGWEGTVLSGANPDNNAEHYNKDYDTYQHLHGLPPGWYTLGLQGFYRRGTYSNDYALWLENDTANYNALLYAASAKGDYSVPLVPVSSEAILERLGGSVASVGAGYYIPNDMVAAGAWFKAGYYNNYLDVEVGDDGELTIGIKKDVTISDDWTMIDNWTLFRTDNNPVKMITPDAATFKVKSVNEMGFVVSWENVPGARYYDIVVKEQNGTYSSPVFKRSLSATSIEVTGLKPNTYYLFKVRARNGNRNQDGDWGSVEKPVKTAEVGTNPAQIGIEGLNTINRGKPLSVGQTYLYNVWIKNSALSFWKGKLCLKEGEKLIKEWTNISIPANFSWPLECYYTPETIGLQSLVLYYKTFGSSEEIPVNYGTAASNLLLVQVNEADGNLSGILKLEKAIECPEKMKWGSNASIIAHIRNGGDKEWKGLLYLTDNGNPLTIAAATIGAGKSYTLKLPKWAPTPEEHHTITVIYKTEKEIDQQLVSSNGFTNPVSVEVSDIDVPTTATEAVLTLITTDCASKEINEGDEVFYHYRIKDKNGIPLKGMRAHFECTGSHTMTSIYTTPSDAEGYASLSLSTEGKNAFGIRGDNVKFTCTHLVDELGNKVDFYNANSKDGCIELAYHKGNGFTRVTGFENVESVEVVFDRGFSGKAEFGKIASASAGVSFPASTKFKWKDGQFLTEVEVEWKGQLAGSLDLNFIKGGLEAYAGYRANTEYNWTNPNKTIIAILMAWISGVEMASAASALRSVMSIESWFEKKNNNFHNIIESGPNFSSFWGIVPKLKGEFDMFKNVSTITKSALGKSTLFPDLSLTGNFEKYKLKAAVDASFRIEPDKEKTNLITGEHTYAVSKNMKIKLSGDFSYMAGDLSPAKLTIWGPKGTYTEKFDNMYYKVLNNGNLWDFNAGLFFNMSSNEEEIYKDSDKQQLKELSNSLETEAGFEISFKTLGKYIYPGWMTEKNLQLSEGNGKNKYAFYGSTSLRWEKSSKGDWASWLQKLSNYPDSREIVSNIFPVLKDDYLLQTPYTYFNLLRDNVTLTSALQYASDNTIGFFAVKDAFKVEQKESQKAELNISIPIAKWWLIDVSLDMGLKFKFSHYPSVTYYSVADKRFFPVVMRSTTLLSSLMKNTTTWLGDKIKSAFSNDDKEEINKEYEEMGKKVEDWAAPDLAVSLSTMGKKHVINNRVPRIKRKHPMLVNQQQKDICTFTYTINEGTPNFNKETKVGISHFYPAGCLIGLTEQNDTRFVLSEVCELNGIQDGDAL